MDDQQISDYINKQVEAVMRSPRYIHLTGADNASARESIEAEISRAVIETLIDNANEEQLAQLEKIDPQSSEMEQQVSMIAATIPGLAVQFEEAINGVVAKLANPLDNS